MDGLHFPIAEMSVMGPGTSDYILGMIRTLSLVTTLDVCLGGGLRSTSAFLVSYFMVALTSIEFSIFYTEFAVYTD